MSGNGTIHIECKSLSSISRTNGVRTSVIKINNKYIYTTNVKKGHPAGVDS